MPSLTEGKLSCHFRQNWQATKYDNWSFYRSQFASCCNSNKSMDFLVFDPKERTLWMIELKDYRRSGREKEINLWDEVAIKTRDTLAGLFAAKVERGHDEHLFAQLAIQAEKLRVVLHLEQPRTNTILFPRIFNPAAVQQKLKQLVKPIDPHPKVIELQNMRNVPWTAESAP